MAPLFPCPCCGFAMENLTNRGDLRWQYLCINLDCVDRRIVQGHLINDWERAEAERQFQAAHASMTTLERKP